MSNLRNLTLADMRDGLKAKKFSAVELAEAHLAAIEKSACKCLARENQVNSYLLLILFYLPMFDYNYIIFNIIFF